MPNTQPFFEHWSVGLDYADQARLDIMAGYREPWDYEEPTQEVEDWEYQQAEERSHAMYSLSPSQFVEQAILVPNSTTRHLEPYSFDTGRRYLRRVYDTPSKRRLLMCGRQVEKSTFLGNYNLTMACLVPHFKVLYVSPSSTQTKVFSKDRLKEPMETCPVLRAWFPGQLTDNVFEKKALNRSSITLRYAFLNADRTRGIPADMIEIDEFQDILLDNVAVIEECASHSPFKLFCYSGTPKSLDNPIEYYWQTYSTQNEWAVPCERHGTPKSPGSWHWNILGEEHIGAEGLICDKCGGPISPQHPEAQWVQMGRPDPAYAEFEGFRIPQLMVPWISHEDILAKYNSYPRTKFYNEVLGRSFDSGQRPLTKQDVIDNCDPKFAMLGEDGARFIANIRQKFQGPLYAGVDWGQDSSNSYTVLSIGGYIDGFFRYLLLHRFIGQDSEPRAQLSKIYEAMDTLGIRIIGVDHGGGYWPNSELLRRYGSQRVMRYQYSSPSKYMVFDQQLGRYLVHKAEVMSAFFNAIKRRSVVRFPRWNDFQNPFASDCLSIFSEYNEKTRLTEYKKSPNTTDDAFHSMLYCFLASMLEFPRPDVFVPNANVDRLHMEAQEIQY